MEYQVMENRFMNITVRRSAESIALELDITSKDEKHDILLMLSRKVIMILSAHMEMHWQDVLLYNRNLSIGE